jgi:hypothetical protein
MPPSTGHGDDGRTSMGGRGAGAERRVRVSRRARSACSRNTSTDQPPDGGAPLGLNGSGPGPLGGGGVIGGVDGEGVEGVGKLGGAGVCGSVGGGGGDGNGCDGGAAVGSVMPGKSGPYPSPGTVHG